MMLLDKLSSDPIISQFICEECSENNFAAEFEDKLKKSKNYLIIKVDDYYNSLQTDNQTPPSPDCLIFVKCDDANNYNIYIIELKNIKSKNGFNIKNIRSKFKTCVNSFMKDVIRNYLNDDKLVFNNIKLYFVTDPYNERLCGSRLSKATKMDALLALNTQPFIFDGKRLFIEHKFKNPIITSCK